MVDFTLNDEQLTLQRTARDLATREIAPIAEQVERMDHASTAPWDLVRPVFQKASRLGIPHLLIPEEYGGGGGSCLDNALVQEEFGAVDVGIAAAYFNLAATAPRVIVAGGTEAQKREWLGEICASDDFLVASAGSEADQAGSDTFCPYPDPRVGLRTTSRRDGDDYVLDGTKAAFITSAGIASAYFVMARNDLGKPGFTMPRSSWTTSGFRRTGCSGSRSSSPPTSSVRHTRTSRWASPPAMWGSRGRPRSTRPSTRGNGSAGYSRSSTIRLWHGCSPTRSSRRR